MTSRPPVPPPRSPNPLRNRRRADAAATVVLSLAVLVLAFYAFVLAALFQMATVNCRDDCSLGAVNAATVFAWTGIVVALVTAGIGIARSHRRGGWMFVWPIAAAVLIVATWMIGVVVVETAVS
ncbi:hypothetical protein [Rhodococcus triatomae]